MPSYQYMYLVPREVYERTNFTSRGETNCGSKGDTLNGNVQGAAQVNHIEMAEGTKLTIKPNRGLAVDSDDKQQRAKNPTAAVEKAEEEREAELEDEDEDADVPFVVGDADLNFGDDEEEGDDSGSMPSRRDRKETRDFGVQTSLPPVISGNSINTQTDLGPGTSSMSSQTLQQTSDRTSQTGPWKRVSDDDEATSTDDLQTTHSKEVQTDPMARINLDDMTDLRRKAISNWSKIRRNSSGSQITKRIPYAALNDRIPMQQKLEMMRKIIRDQVGAVVSQSEGRRVALPSMAGVNVSPDVPEPFSFTLSPTPRSPAKMQQKQEMMRGIIGDQIDAAVSKSEGKQTSDMMRKIIRDQVGTAVSKSNKSKSKKVSAAAKRAAVEQAIKAVMQSSKASMSARRAAVEEAIKSVIRDSKQMDTSAPPVVRTVTEAPMITDVPKRKGTKRKRQTVRTVMDPPMITDFPMRKGTKRKQQSDQAVTAKKLQVKKKPVAKLKTTDEDGDEQMREHIEERLAELQGTRKTKGKRTADEMEWPEEIEIRSGQSEKKKNKSKK